MRFRLVGLVAAGVASLCFVQGEASPATTKTPAHTAHTATTSNKTPPPTVTVAMAAPTGSTASPALDASWDVRRAGVEGALSVQGKTVTPTADAPDSPLPIPAPFLTTVTATWTSGLLHLRTHDFGLDVVLSWDDGVPPTKPGDSASTSGQLLRYRYCDPKGHWGRWTTLFSQPFRDSIPAFLTTGGPAPKVFTTLHYPGKLPGNNVRLQFGLTDTLIQGALLQQTLNIDLDPASHGQV